MSYLEKDSLKVVGTRPIRPDGVDKVTGRANFGADMKMPGMLGVEIKRSSARPCSHYPDQHR
jgi:CO/xanthine dehydrogenase Mo-binding subunit